MAASILLYGKDHYLLKTRAMVLERSRMHVAFTCDLADATELAVHLPLTLVIFCHSLSAEERHEAWSVLSGLRPGIQSLVLTRVQSRAQIDLYHDRHTGILDAAAGPIVLLSTVDRMLNITRQTISH